MKSRPEEKEFEMPLKMAAMFKARALEELGHFKENYEIIDCFVDRIEIKLKVKLPSADKEIMALYKDMSAKMNAIEDYQRVIKGYLNENMKTLSSGSQKQLNILLRKLNETAEKISSLQKVLKQTQPNLISDVAVEQFRKLKEHRLEKKMEAKEESKSPPQTFNSKLVHDSRRTQQMPKESNESVKKNNPLTAQKRLSE